MKDEPNVLVMCLYIAMYQVVLEHLMGKAVVFKAKNSSKPCISVINKA